MHVLLAVVIFLLGVIAGTLVLLYFSRESATERLIHTLHHLATERQKHADSTATVLLKERRIATQAILKELRAAAKERRELMSFARGDWEADEPTRVPLMEVNRLSTLPPPPGPVHVDPDALTPPSGYPLVHLFQEEANT